MTSFQRPQRLVFGEVAELYDRHRPSYPAQLFDELIDFAALAPGDAALEVGAGTGKATVPLVQRGLRLTALEPSHQMATIARAKLAGAEGVHVIETSFEDWEPGLDRYRLICSAQAWHWVAPQIGYPKAATLLLPTGVLALFWNRPEPGDKRTQFELDQVYRRLAPDLTARLPGELEVDRSSEIAESSRFGAVSVREFRWEVRYDTEEYKALLTTQSNHRLLPPTSLDRLLEGVGEVLENAGGTFMTRYVTRLYLARPLT